jgi:hypothetical protein
MQPERNLKEKSTNNALHSQGLKASEILHGVHAKI